MSLETMFKVYMLALAVIFSPWALGLFLNGIMRAWDEIDSLKRYLKGW